jgi:hypothetical protein
VTIIPNQLEGGVVPILRNARGFATSPGLAAPSETL